MKSIDYECAIQIDPEEVMDSLSVKQIETYLLARKTVEESDGKAKFGDLTREEEEYIFFCMIRRRCPRNMEGDKKSIKDAIKSLVDEYLNL